MTQKETEKAQLRRGEAGFAGGVSAEGKNYVYQEKKQKGENNSA